jgi:hypothetical protein
MERLEQRRIKQDLILTYKIYFRLVDIKATDLFTLAKTDRDTRGHKYKLLQNHCRVDVRKYYFAERIVRQWNIYVHKNRTLVAFAGSKSTYIAQIYRNIC